MNTNIISHIEAAISLDVGRSTDRLATLAKGGLFAAANSIAQTPAPKIGIITGFFIPHATPPAAENDGLVGSAHMVAGFVAAGFAVRIATDAPCESAVRAAVRAAGVNVPIDIVAIAPNDNGVSINEVISTWQNENITHAISIERCGLSYDATPRNSRGDDISAYTAPLDELFLGGPWETIAIGDGGNEIGMGTLDKKIIAQNIENGGAIACRTPANHLIVAGVSNWGAWALLAATAMILPQKKDELTKTITAEKELEMLQYINQHGPSVDGMTGLTADTVDGIEFEFHENILKQVIGIIS
ncbi:MAG: DUF4392 domain-containing protein [Rhodospirillaceae bacterium]|nr:DUF4392 domain-containing protein [Rhodospirillaceae bacterium]